MFYLISYRRLTVTENKKNVVPFFQKQPFLFPGGLFTYRTDNIFPESPILYFFIEHIYFLIKQISIFQETLSSHQTHTIFLNRYKKI